MTPTEKAKELYDKFYRYVVADSKWDDDRINDAKQCALIAVEELHKNTCSHCDDPVYWDEVKKGIEKL